MKIKFYLTKNHSNKAGEAPIRSSISIKGTRLQKSIGYNVLPAKWNPAKQEVESGYVNTLGHDARHINRRIANLKSHFADYELDLYDKPTEKDLRIQFELALNKKDNKEQAQAKAEEKVEKRKRGRPRKEETETKPTAPGTIEAYIDEFLREEKIAQSWADSTVRMLGTFKNHILKFKKATHPDYFTREGIDAFLLYLRSSGLQENSARKQLKNLLWFMNWAIRKGYTRETTIQTYKPKFKLVDKPIVFLDNDELMALYNYQVPATGTVVTLTDYNGNEYTKEVPDGPALDRARDLFCFCAFTSLRYSDMAELRRSNIDYKNKVLHITTQKTNDSLDIDLNPMALAILRKYQDQSFPGDRALPVISNQKLNDHLKPLCEFCGINSPYTETCIRNGKRETEVFPKYAKVSTHAARRSFICFALASGIPPQVVMKWTGHCDYKSMTPYIDVAGGTKSAAMRRIADSWEE